MVKKKTSNMNLSFYEADMLFNGNAPFLISLSNCSDEELRIVISAANVGEAGEYLPNQSEINNQEASSILSILENSRPIIPNEEKQYELIFTDYIMYQIRNESYASFYPDEIPNGKYLITFEKSRLLSNLVNITDAQILSDGTHYPGKWTHYGIHTQRHLIDVVSLNTPTISILNANSLNHACDRTNTC